MYKNLLLLRSGSRARLHFTPCWLSWCLRRSTLRWKPLEQMSHPNGLKPVCFLLWVIRLELWLNALPHTWHLWGFSPKNLNATVRNQHNQILDDFQTICVKNSSFSFNGLWSIRVVIYTKKSSKIKFAFVSMGEESCHCSDLLNIYWQQTSTA